MDSPNLLTFEDVDTRSGARAEVLADYFGQCMVHVQRDQL